MSTRRATCSCGGLSVTCEGEPVRVGLCHCLACQRRTGSAFGVQARFAPSQVTIAGPSTAYVRVGDDGGRITFHFCPTCGTTVHWQIDTQPDVVAVAVGAFADPGFPPPKYTVYEARRHAWAALSELEAERYD